LEHKEDQLAAVDDFERFLEPPGWRIHVILVSRVIRVIQVIRAT
jgi:hypothetical protein